MIELKKILFRCDSSSFIGLGHVKRCLVLAKRLKEIDDSLDIVFTSLDSQGNINQEILENNYTLEILEDNSLEVINQKIKNLGINFLIIDSYDINEVFEKELKRLNQGLKIMSFDDTLKAHNSDIVLNHGLHSKKSDYDGLVPSSCKVLCGSKYTLLRDEFFKRYGNIREDSIAIILGGNDVLNLSSKIADYLFEINTSYQISIITSKVNPHMEELKRRKDIDLLVDISNIAEVLSSKEFIITASGGTLFEIMALKKRFINIEVASNQKKVTNFLEEKSIKTTIKAENLDLKKLKSKIEYIKQYDIYEKLELHFSKDKLAKEIIEELV